VGTGLSLNLSPLNLDLLRGDEPRSTARRDKGALPKIRRTSQQLSPIWESRGIAFLGLKKYNYFAFLDSLQLPGPLVDRRDFVDSLRSREKAYGRRTARGIRPKSLTHRFGAISWH